MRASIRYVLTLAISTAACHTMRVVPLDQAAGMPSVSVTLHDKSVVVLDDPKIYGNKLVGFVNGKYQEIPTARVQAAHVRETNGARTAALVVAGAVGFAGFAYVITGAGKSKAPEYCDDPDHVDEPICQSM
jgi:hypothetical protein